jgi:GNAT superfamily N-acetyltransferase
MGQMQMVRFRPEYLDSIIELHRSAITGMEIGINQLDEEADLRDIERVYLRDGGEFLVGLIGDTVVAMGGFRRISDTSAELRRMRINKEHQDNGYGSQLLIELERRAARSGIRNLSFETAKSRPLTLEFYHKHGYRETGEGFYGKVGTVYFTKDLPASGD